MKRYTTLLEAIYRLYEHSGFAMSGAVAYAAVVSLFPFCIFLGAVAGVVGGRPLAAQAIEGLFQILPPDVVKSLAPQVDAIMGSSRIDLLTVGGGIALFFATSAVETLRAALNGAYRQRETRPYIIMLAMAMVFVFVSAVSMLLLTWLVLVGPGLAAQFEPSWLKNMLDSTWLTASFRYLVGAVVMIAQLTVLHLWLAAGKRRFADIWPGILLTTVLWLAAAGLYSHYLSFSDYSRFYAGLTQVMVALIFFQVSAMIVLLGAELNRGIMELKKLASNGLGEVRTGSNSV